MSDFLEITENYKKIKKLIPDDIELVAVSKTHEVDKIQQIYDLGQRRFGENKVQELVEKQALLPNDIEWHLIGHLQTNKVKYIASFVDTIQSVDSEKLLEEINKQAEKNNRIIKVLLQIKIAEEDTKFGLELDEAEEIFQDCLSGKFPHISITGLMGLATFTNDKDLTNKEFSYLKQAFDKMSLRKNLETLSMGMSDDFLIAIDCGANSVRVGSGIFGQRNYNL